MFCNFPQKLFISDCLLYNTHTWRASIWGFWCISLVDSEGLEHWEALREEQQEVAVDPETMTFEAIEELLGQSCTETDESCSEWQEWCETGKMHIRGYDPNWLTVRLLPELCCLEKVTHTLVKSKQKSPGRATSRSPSQPRTLGGREKMTLINMCIANKQMHDKNKDQLPLPQARWSKC